MSEENNKLIAEFMGAKYINDWWHVPVEENYIPTYRSAQEFQYRYNWAWLMAVGKKCFDICQNQQRPNVNACNKLDFIECEIGMHVREYNIDGAYQEIINFITLYNQQQKAW